MADIQVKIGQLITLTDANENTLLLDGAFHASDHRLIFIKVITAANGIRFANAGQACDNSQYQFPADDKVIFTNFGPGLPPKVKGENGYTFVVTC